MDTGFRRHIDSLVDREGEFLYPEQMENAKATLGEKAEARWFNVEGLGYDKPWMCVIGIK